MPLRGVEDIGEDISDEEDVEDDEEEPVEAVLRAEEENHWLRKDRTPPAPKDGRRGGR